MLRCGMLNGVGMGRGGASAYWYVLWCVVVYSSVSWYGVMYRGVIYSVPPCVVVYICIAMCCCTRIVLWYGGVACGMVWCAVVCCGVVCCDTSWYIVVCVTTLSCDVLCRYLVMYGGVCYTRVWCGAVYCNMALCCGALCCRCGVGCIMLCYSVGWHDVCVMA